MSARTAEVLAHHLQAFVAGDVSELLKDYTDESVLIHGDGVVSGLKDLAAFFGGIGEVFPTGKYTLDMLRQEISGEVAYILWKADTPGFDIPLGTDTFVVRDGKITVQTFAGHLIPK